MFIDPYDFRPARIAQLVHESTHAVRVRVVTQHPYPVCFGQHAVVRVSLPDGSKLVRQYSFSLQPDTDEIWWTITEQPNGIVSGWFNRIARTGDPVEISRPFTGPFVQKIPRGHICIIAGGSGIAPLIGLVRLLRHQQHSFSLIYSTRTSQLCYRDELVAQPNETITIRLTDTTERLMEKDITQHISRTSTVFLCGSRPFVTTMRAYCEKSITADHIVCEAFSL